MVFRSITNTVYRKKKALEKKGGKQVDLEKYFRQFLVYEYGDFILEKIKYTIFYDPKEDRLTLQTNSKIFANDLLLKINKFSEFLNKSLARVSQIVIK